MPLAFQRTYVSDRSEDIGLGVGWSFMFTDRINLNGDKATLTGINGTTNFRREGQGQRFVLRNDQPGVHQEFEVADSVTIIERAQEVRRVYKKIGDTYHLVQITAPGEISVLISHDVSGKISRVASEPGGSLTFQWSGGREPRLLAVADNAGERVSFTQNGRSLRSIIDANGSEWTYDYMSGRLRQANDPLGRVLLQMRYDKSGHVTSAGDGIGVTRYGYRFGSSEVSRRTVVTDPLNATTFYEQTDLGALASVSDDQGHSVHVEYNAANRPTKIWDSAGNEMTFGYDGQNRLLTQSTNGSIDHAYSFSAKGQLSSSTDGTERTDVTLDSRGQAAGIQTSDPQGGYTATFDKHGALTQLKSEKREVTFERDAQGRETSATYSDIGRFSFARDAAGRVNTMRFPSGLAVFNEYDANGAFTKQSDSRGRSVTVQRDFSGAPTVYIRADGKQMRAVRDGAGRVIEDTDFDGNVRRLAYNARGGLTDYTVRGQHRKFAYDLEGRLSAIIDDDGTTRKVERDERGRIQRLRIAVRGRSIAFNPQAAPLQSLVDRRWAHTSTLQDPPPPPPDEVLDVITIDIWAPYYPGIGPGGGNQHPPLLAAPGDGGDGGGETRQQCIARHVMSCNLTFYGCLLVTLGVGLAFLGGCTLATFIVGVPVCEVIADVIVALGAGACLLNGFACINNSADGCPA